VADRFCGNCGNALSEDDRFCRNCGTPVHEAAVVPTPEADVDNIQLLCGYHNRLKSNRYVR
jgi:predicted amidophosphoribosyltransferase